MPFWSTETVQGWCALAFYSSSMTALQSTKQALPEELKWLSSYVSLGRQANNFGNIVAV